MRKIRLGWHVEPRQFDSGGVGGIILAGASYCWGLKMDAPTSINAVIALDVGVTVASIAVMWVSLS